jgi:excisionase family DNA binding protein
LSDFVTVSQIAEQLELSEDFIYSQLAPAGTLRSYRFGIARRVRKDDLDKWIAEREERGEGGEVVPLRSRVG